MTVGRRLQQVADLLRAELASLVQQNLRDPRVGFVTVTGVRLSPDLGSARVYVTVLGDPGREEEALEALGRAAGYLRRELACGRSPSSPFIPTPRSARGPGSRTSCPT